MKSDKIAFRAYKETKSRRQLPDELKKDRALKEKINKASKAIRKKYLALKLGKAENDETLNRLLKPVIKPLEEIKSLNSEKNKKLVVKKEPLPEGDIGQRSYSNALQLKSELKSETGEEEETESMDEDEADMITTDFNEYINQYPLLTRSYIKELYKRNKNYDDTYGVRFDDKTNKLYIGNTELRIGTNAGIGVGKKMYTGSKGLYDLLFLKNPKDYNDNDLSDYKEILETSSAHKRNYNPASQFNGSRSSKYTNIIKPLFNDGDSLETKPPTGSGISNMIYNEKPIEYVYWDDVNELVDRLRLLNASKLAGNSDSHDNEILAIISELREAGIIY